MDITKFTQSRAFTVTIIVIAFLLSLLLSFGLGVSVGYHKARFSYQWSENYDQTFGGPHHGLFGFFGGNNFLGAHGIFGSVVKVDGSTLVIKGQDGVERTVVINDDTVIHRSREILKPGDIRVDDHVVIIGSPDNVGQLVAKLMRILPPVVSPSATPSSPAAR